MGVHTLADMRAPVETLTKLSEVLSDRGLKVVEARSDYGPAIRVWHPDGERLAEVITLARDGDRWAFCWSWGEPIAIGIDDVASVAKTIAHVVTPPAGDV